MEEIIHYLEMNSREEFKPVDYSFWNFKVMPVERSQYRLHKFLYSLIGHPWDWKDRLIWSDDEWMELVSDPSVKVWIAMCEGIIAGYFELQVQEEGSVEIRYFGLEESFIGQGLGGPFLSYAVEKAWELGAERVWLHTCNGDHPYALKNYTDRGFVKYKEERD